MTMTTEKPVSTIDTFRTLDDGEVLIGYMDGFSGIAPASDGSSRSYLHGWRNGMIESARLLPDQAYLDLQRAFELGRSAS